MDACRASGAKLCLNPAELPEGWGNYEGYTPMTPESMIKAKVKEYLAEIGCISASKAPLATHGNTGYYFSPVSNGMGVHGIPDFIGHYRGFFFSIETKTEKKNPTPLQQHQIRAIEITGGKNFVVRGVDDVGQIQEWAKRIDFLALGV